LAKGSYIFRPSGHPGVNPIQKNAYPKPASLKRLNECGVLRSAVIFWSTGMGVERVRVDKNGYAGQGFGNDRPIWTMNPSTEEDWKEVEAHYQEFVQLSQFWVESGMLQP
jgi:hypothetical protein